MKDADELTSVGRASTKMVRNQLRLTRVTSIPCLRMCLVSSGISFSTRLWNTACVCSGMSQERDRETGAEEKINYTHSEQKHIVHTCVHAHI